MEERKFIRLKKEEFGIKEYIKRDLGKGKISKLDIEYTPVGEKIIVHTSRPGLVIGRRGEKIGELTEVLKKRFKLENPHIEIKEIENPLFDAQLTADDIAMALERMGNLKFKVIAYRKLQEIMNAGALGCEMRLTGKLPSERAKSWRFADGYLKKAGEPSKEIDRAQATALTKTGIIGVKVAIMPPDAKIYDKIDINKEMLGKIKGVVEEVEEVEGGGEVEEKPKRKRVKKTEKKEKGEEDTDNKEKDKASESSQDAEKLEDTNKVKEEIKEFDESQEIPVEEDGTAIEIEQEIEEGVSEEDVEEIEKVDNSERDKDEESSQEAQKLEDTKEGMRSSQTKSAAEQNDKINKEENISKGKGK